MSRREISGKGQKTFNVLNYSMMTIFVCLIVLPFIHILSISFSTQSEAIRFGLHLFPQKITTVAYKRIFGTSEIWRAYIVTILRTCLGTTLSLVLTALGGYVLSKKYLPHRVFYTSIIVFTMFFSGGLIPTFLLVKSLGLLDSYLSLLLPNAIHAFYLLIMRNYFMTVPISLEDSARIDGAADWRILFSIYMPVAKPLIATVGLWYAVSSWNAWFDCLIYIRDPGKFVLQIILRQIIFEGTQEILDNQLFDQGSMSHPDSVRAAAIFVTTIPIMLVYPFIQKYFVKGIMIGSLKG